MLCKHIEDNYADNTGTDITGRSNCKSEAVTAGKAERLIGRTDIVRLSRSLTEAHGQQQSACFEQSGHKGVSKTDRDNKACDTLREICSDYYRTGFKSVELSCLRLFAARHTKRHGYKAECNAVVNYHLEHIRVKLYYAEVF